MTLMQEEELLELTPTELAVGADMAFENFYFFERYMFFRRFHETWKRGPQHPIMCDALNAVYEGQCNRLIINVPPRYSKTETCVVNWVPWCMGHVPDAQFMYTSYSAEVAEEYGGKARDLLMHEAYRDVFRDVMINKKHAGQKSWGTTQGGVLYSTGAGGTITGKGAGKKRNKFGGAIIIDDPHKPDEAHSDTIRPKVLKWFQDTLFSRRNSRRTPIVLIMQRLHEEDLAGWLLAGGTGEHWEHVCLPAIQCDRDADGKVIPGTQRALWPEMHTLDDLYLMERTQAYTFAGQYMQSPSAAEGNVYKPDNIEIIDALPANAKTFRWVRGWDFAGSIPKKGTDPDYTCGYLLGEDLTTNTLYIADLIRTRTSPEEVKRLFVQTCKNDGPSVTQDIPQDPGQAGKAQVHDFVKAAMGFIVSFSTESGSKTQRSETYAAQINIPFNVKMLRAPWNRELINEKRVFPNGAHDDICDSGSRAFMKLNEMKGPMNISDDLLNRFRARRG